MVDIGYDQCPQGGTSLLPSGGLSGAEPTGQGTPASFGSATEVAEGQEGGPEPIRVNGPQMQDEVGTTKEAFSLSATGT